MKAKKNSNLTAVLRTYLRHNACKPSTDLDERILSDGLAAMGGAAPGRSAWAGWGLGRIIMKSRLGKISIAAVVVITVFLGWPGGGGQPAWALQETIEALKAYHAVHITGSFLGQDGKPVTGEFWLRDRHMGKKSRDLVLRIATGGMVWVKDNHTFNYQPHQNTVYIDRAVTAGFSHWFGPRLFCLIQSLDDVKTVYGRDPATGKERVTLFGSITDVHGVQSWIFEFDTETKLPVRMRQWYNLDRSGPPAFDGHQIVYYEFLDDEIFTVAAPPGVQYVENPPTIPEQNLSLLADPRAGQAVGGRPLEAAAEDIVRELYQEAIDGSITRLKELCPIAAQWSDRMLEEIALGKIPEEKPVAIHSIGSVSYQGRTKLGPFMVVPATIQRQDGSLWQENQIVQFRGAGESMSCVIHGPYGLPVQVE